jgi:hypothetical protein
MEIIIVRPALVFGGPSSMFGLWFNPLVKGRSEGTAIQVEARPKALIATVHKEDLAEAYRLVVEKV